MQKVDFIERFFILSFTFFAWIAVINFILMRTDSFNVNYLAGSLILFVILFPILLKRYPDLMGIDGERPDVNINKIFEIIFLVSILLLAGLLYGFFPSYYLLGGRDPGLYFLFSAHIANTGGLVLDLPVLRDLYNIYGEKISLGYPGIYSAYERGLSDDPAVLIPQFMHLFPSIGAIFYKFAGLEGLVRTNAVIAVFALWSFFIVARRLVGSISGLIATLALALNAAFIWNARLTLTEVLAVFFLFGGLHLLIKAFDLKSPIWAAASGAVLGFALLNRIDSAFNVIIILGATFFALIRPDYFRTVVLPLCASYFLFSSWAFIDGYLHSFPYFYDLWMGGGLKGLFYLNYGVLILSMLLFVLIKKWPLNSLDLGGPIDKMLKASMIILALWICFAFFFWHKIDDGFNARSIRELAWYVTPLIYFIFLYGLWSSIGLRDKNPIFIPLIVMGLLTFFIFTWRPTITPDHIWASRRWIPQVIPLLIIFAAFGIKVFIVKPTFRLARIAAAILTVAYYFWTTLVFASPYLFKSMLSGVRSGYTSVVHTLNDFESPYDTIITNNKQFASIMTYVYGKQTILVEDNAAKLISITSMDGFLFLGFDENSRGELIWCSSIEGLYLEKTLARKPLSLINRSYNSSIGRIDSGGD